MVGLLCLILWIIFLSIWMVIIFNNSKNKKDNINKNDKVKNIIDILEYESYSSNF